LSPVPRRNCVVNDSKQPQLQLVLNGDLYFTNCNLEGVLLINFSGMLMALIKTKLVKFVPFYFYNRYASVHISAALNTVFSRV